MNEERGTKNEVHPAPRGEQNPKNIIVRNTAGQARRARKSELAWYAQRGFQPVDKPQPISATK